MIRRPPRSPLFPSTPLSRPPTPVPRHRSHCEADRDCQQDGERPDAERDTSAVDEPRPDVAPEPIRAQRMDRAARSEEHTSELQSQSNIVCRLLLEKKNAAPDVRAPRESAPPFARFPQIPCVDSSRKIEGPMASQLLATKSIAELHEQESTGNQLRRALTATQLTLLGIGGVIGTGIFVLTGVAAANNAGPALPLSFIVAGIGCTFAGLCYAEFAAMIPVSGSAYSYSYATLGEGIAWFIGWNLVLEYLFAVATVSVGWSGYVVSLLDQWHLHIPDALSHAPLDHGAVALE